MSECADKIFAEGKKCLIFDFADVKYVPSIAVGHIMNAYIMLKNANIGFYLCNVDKTPKRVLDMAIGNSGIPMDTDLETVLQGFGV